MAIDPQNFNGQVTAPSSTYPKGQIIDDNGPGIGTEMDEKSFGDIFQFFIKLMLEAGISYNNLPDNEYSGNQFFEAARKLFSRPSTYVPFDRLSSIVLEPDQRPLCEIIPGAPNSGAIGLKDSAFVKYDLGTVIVTNRSSNACDIFPGGTDELEGSTSPYSLAAGGKVELCLNMSATTPNWLIISES